MQTNTKCSIKKKNEREYTLYLILKNIVLNRQHHLRKRH